MQIVDLDTPRMGRRRMSAGARRTVLRQVLVAGMVLVFLIPFAVMVGTAFTPADSLYSTTPSLWPKEWTLDNFVAAAQRIPLARYFGNTLLISTIAVIGTLISCPLVAYSLVKVPWRGRNALFIVVLATMMLPPQVTMIPIYLMWNGIGQTNSYLPLIVPAFFGTPFIIFLLRQFLRNLPDDLIDAARMDGASEFRIYWSIVLPLLRPALVTAAIFQFQASWTDFLGPLLYINDSQMFTLSLGLNDFFGQYGIEWGPLMAACVLFTAPTIVIFAFTSRFFIGGQMAGALK